MPSLVTANTNINPITNTGGKQYKFSMIDNYIYLYHTGTLIVIPTYPDSVHDSTSVDFSQTIPLQRSAPIYSYAKSGPRSMDIQLHFHRDLIGSIYYLGSTQDIAVGQNSVGPLDDDYADIIIREIQAAALPNYGASEKMVNPPLIAIRFGTDIYCKGVVGGNVGVTYSGPILEGERYALLDIAFSINEVDPYDALSVMQVGSYRGLDTSLGDSRNTWRVAPSFGNSVGGYRPNNGAIRL